MHNITKQIMRQPLRSSSEQHFLDHEAWVLTLVPLHRDHLVCNLLLKISQLILTNVPLKVQAMQYLQ